MITPCPFANEACPHYAKEPPAQLYVEQEHGCYSDTDHIVPQSMGRKKYASALLRNYIDTPANKVQKCRWEHDAKTNEDIKVTPIVPSEQFMIDAIKRARARK